MKAQVTAIWFDVSPEGSDALSIKEDSPLYDPEWHQPGQMVTAYSVIEKLDEVLAKETGLSIVSNDHHYTLQVQVDVSEIKTLIIFNIQKKLQEFVARHFNPYSPEQDTTRNGQSND